MSTDSKGDGGRFGEIKSVNKMVLEKRREEKYGVLLSSSSSSQHLNIILFRQRIELWENKAKFLFFLLMME